MSEDDTRVFRLEHDGNKATLYYVKVGLKVPLIEVNEDSDAKGLFMYANEDEAAMDLVSNWHQYEECEPIEVEVANLTPLPVTEEIKLEQGVKVEF